MQKHFQQPHLPSVSDSLDTKERNLAYRLLLLFWNDSYRIAIASLPTAHLMHYGMDRM